jgi:hypothetical protein
MVAKIRTGAAPSRSHLDAAPDNQQVIISKRYMAGAENPSTHTFLPSPISLAKAVVATNKSRCLSSIKC